MGRWTAEHGAFLKSHGFANPLSLALNASGMTRQEFRAALRDEGKLFAYGLAPCRNGHTIRTAGGCPQCDTAYLAFAKRNVAPGYVYVARSVSSRLIKIGESSSPIDRIYIANLEGYGGIDDWRIRVVAHFDQRGRAETAVKQLLRDYSVERGWVRNGTSGTAREIFRCTLRTAVDALQRVLDGGGLSGTAAR